MNKPLEQVFLHCASSRRQIDPTAFIAPDRGKVIQPTAAPWVDTVKMSRNSAMIPTIGTFRDHQPLSLPILRHPPSWIPRRCRGLTYDAPDGGDQTPLKRCVRMNFDTSNQSRTQSLFVSPWAVRNDVRSCSKEQTL